MGCGTIATPIGALTVISDAGAITRVTWDAPRLPEERSVEIAAALAQIEAYFAGRLTRFDLPLQVGGSDFQRRACAAMQAIPFGETRRYGDLARTLDAPAQAVGGACGANPIPVIIPCHRVLGASGLGGYSGLGGVETKVWLLRLEGAAGLLI